GSYRLKDFDRPERLYQVDIDGLPTRFPPVRATRTEPHRRRWWLVAAGALIACLAAVAVVALTRGGEAGVEGGATTSAVIDPQSNKVVDAIDLGCKSNLIAAGEGAVWIIDPGGSILWRVDPRTHEKKSFGIAVGAGDIPFGVAAGEGAVWVA